MDSNCQIVIWNYLYQANYNKNYQHAYTWLCVDHFQHEIASKGKRHENVPSHKSISSYLNKLVDQGWLEKSKRKSHHLPVDHMHIKKAVTGWIYTTHEWQKLPETYRNYYRFKSDVLPKVHKQLNSMQSL